MKLTTTDDIYEMMTAFVGSAALNAALELGLFWHLAQQPSTAQEVAQAFRIPRSRCQYWLEVLLEMGLLERADGIYSVSPATRTAILDVHSQSTWSFRAGYRRKDFPTVIDLALHLQDPGSVLTAQGLEAANEYQRLQSDADWAARFTGMGYEYHQRMAVEIAATLDMTGIHRMMDLGGGSGVVSMTLLKQYPQLTSVVVDFEHACTAGRAIADATSVADRITYFPADFLRDQLPTGFDLVLECEVGIHNAALFRKVYETLNRNGQFVLVAPWAPSEGLPPTGEAKMSFLGALKDPDFQYTVTATKQAFLEEAGFHHISEQVLSNGRFLLEARK